LKNITRAIKLILRNIKEKKIASITLSILIMIVLIGSYYIVRSRYIKKIDIYLRPPYDFPIIETKHYMQNDPLWAFENIGNTKYTMGGSGCLVTCVSVSLNYLGVEINPQELNKKLTDVNGYINGELVWYKINDLVSSVNYSFGRIFSSKTIENDLRNNRLPIVNVRFNGNGITHWVIIVGAKNGDYLIFDPLNKDETPLPLKKHGKVFAYRVLKKIK
jgi:hypothetical protein